MKSQHLDEIIACLPSFTKGKTHYRYFRGGYAPQLLSLLLPSQVRLRDLNQTRYASLAKQLSVKPLIAQCGDGILRREQVNAIWQEPSQPFLLSLSRWGGKRSRDWYQTSRFGENLVLQLNLPLQSQRNFTKGIDPSGYDNLNGHWTQHPVQLKDNNAGFRDTLAWSRIDLDFNLNEALIEEIQSDGVRDIKRWAKNYQKCGCKQCQRSLKYVRWFQRYAQIWAEAMLMATIDFIKTELGIDRIYMHTARSGWQVKKMSKTSHAPRSLYSDLPKKFAFKQTWAAPEFLLQTKPYQQLIRKQPDIDFYLLNTNELKTQQTQTNKRGTPCRA